MSTNDLSRRGFLATSVLAVAGSQSATTEQDRSNSSVENNSFELTPRPTRVFKTFDRSHERTESWIFSLVVQAKKDVTLTPAALKVTLLRRGSVVRTEDMPAAGFEPLTYHSQLGPRLPDGSPSPTPIFW